MTIDHRRLRLRAAAVGMLVLGCDAASPTDAEPDSAPAPAAAEHVEPAAEAQRSVAPSERTEPPPEPVAPVVAAEVPARAGDIPASFPLGESIGASPPEEPGEPEEPEEPVLAASASGATPLPALPGGVMARVGTVDIPMRTFRSIYDLKVKKYTDRGRDIPASADRRYRTSIAERLIYAEVLAQHARSLGITHDAAVLAEREAQQKRGIRDWPMHLERRGETEASLRAMYVAELLEAAILERRGDLEVTPDEIRDDYDKIKGNWDSSQPRARASHILVRIGPPDEARPASPTPAEITAWEAAAKKEAERLHAEATAPGADFAALARTHSTGPSAAKGGDIGIFTADRMAEEFSDAAFALKVGEVSAPVVSKFGWHIIKLTGKWKPGPLPQSALEDQIVERLQQRKLHTGRRALKEDLLKAVKVENHVAATLGPQPAAR